MTSRQPTTVLTSRMKIAMQAADPTSIQRPSLALLGSEPLRAAFEFVRHRIAKADTGEPGDGHPVVIFPGLGADGHVVAPLREHLRAQGYAAFDWGQGFNKGPQGDIDTWLEVLASRISELLDRHVQPATFIGWSLGGIYARELGKCMAPRLRQVITIGTPFNGEADHTHAGWLFQLLNGVSAPIDPALHARLRTPPPVPTTSLYSRTDGVVAWQACRHAKPSKHTRDIEVPGSHLGMCWNPDVLHTVTGLLRTESPRRF